MSELDRVIARDSAQPHAYLGAHPAESGSGVVIRAFRPSAERVAVWADGAASAVELERVHADGVFEGELAGATLPLSYHFEVEYPGGESFPVEDPYRFGPTLGDVDLHLVGEGRHEELYESLGAHVRDIDGVAGVAFAVWAPSARSLSVVGDFNDWDGRLHQMRSMGSSGVWELFVPGAAHGDRYKYEIRTQEGALQLRADPVAFATEMPPETASVVHATSYEWGDQEWMERRAATSPWDEPMSVYEVHLGSWRRDPGDPERLLSYGELADQLVEYCTEMGFTHVELMPVMGHPFPGSWGYQVTSYYAPTPRHGDPDDFRRFVDAMHRANIGVILDWVPAHFPRDEFALARFDGTALYEHEDPRQGAHPDWGTLVFNFGRNEVKNFLLANALYWTREYHCDGLRVDAVASMLYLDYSRKEGEWVPNVHGGRENLEAVAFLKEMNEVLHAREPGVVAVAEESTAWPGVSKPTYVGGLGFGFKWNMGWMHDTLAYFENEPIYRKYHHHSLTFSLVYAFTENFVLPLSHDEVVHGKGSLLAKMPGDPWQKAANLRALYGFMWAHPGKKLLFQGCDIAQEDEWKYDRSLDWHLLESGPPTHKGMQALIRDLNRVYADQPALYTRDFDHEAFWWLEPNDADNNVFAFARVGTDDELLVCVMNLSPVPREGYRLGLPRAGHWIEALNTDAEVYGGGNVGNLGGVETQDVHWHHQPQSAELTLPPLGVLYLVPG